MTTETKPKLNLLQTAFTSIIDAEKSMLDELDRRIVRDRAETRAFMLDLAATKD